MEQIQQLHRAQLLIAIEIKKICERHNIQYFLDSGSMLGAVRHKGFIPWDDDIDIGMLQKDYHRFLKYAAQELKPPFFLDCTRTNPDNPYVFAKVRLLGTRYVENKADTFSGHNEIFVDVFPYYYISDNKIVRRVEGILMHILAQALLSQAGFKVWKGDHFLKRIKFIPVDAVGYIFSRKQLRRAVSYLYRKHHNTENLCVQSGSSYDFWYFPKEVLTSYIDCQFEDETFKILKEYDAFLSRAYGRDYMNIPPKHKRTTHQIQDLDFGDIINML